MLWIDPPAGWSVDRRLLTAPPAATAVSTEVRRLEFELQAPDDAAPGRVEVPCYALCYVCEGAEGTCLYRRRDVVVPIVIE